MKGNTKIAFIGSGNMTSALIEAIISSGKFPGDEIIITDIDKAKVKKLSSRYINIVSKSNIEAVKESQIIFLAVKPQHMEDVLKEIKKEVTLSKILVSVCAGITAHHIERSVGVKVPVIRIMPNTPSVVGAGAIAITRGRFATRNQCNFIKDLLVAAGLIVELDEDKFDAITALSGSGPAYIFYLCEVLKEAGVLMGIEEKIADKLARQTIYGAGLMLVKSDLEAKELRKNVTSPGGTTEAAIKHLETNAFKGIFIHALKKAKERSKELKK